MLRIYQVHTCSYTIATSQMVQRTHFMTNHEVVSSLFPLCRFSCIGETERRPADRFREHLRDAEQNNTDASKPESRAILIYLITPTIT